jgi:hypothetical protein
MLLVCHSFEVSIMSYHLWVPTVLMLSLTCIATAEKEDSLLSGRNVPPPEEDITGIYRCQGEGMEGKKYEGVVTIEKKKGGSYLLTWLFGPGEKHVGVGVRKGDALAVTSATRLPEGIAVSVVLYEIEQGPKLNGQFTALGGDGTVLKETLTFVRRFKER